MSCEVDSIISVDLPSVNDMETRNVEWSNVHEKSPLIRQYSRDLNAVENTAISYSPDDNRNLSTFAGVFSPVALSMFSTVLFLRLGFVIGQAGLFETILQFVLAYFILLLTVLSICAISTNGAVEGGGAYFMISRALGPEFGGSIGLLFFLANVFACGLYISGFVETLVENFGTGGSLNLENSLPTNGVDDGKWWKYLYATVVLLFCLIVCLVGGALFARTSVVILVVVVLCIGSVILSFFIVKKKCIHIPKSNTYYQWPNTTNTSATNRCFNYTGYKDHTFNHNVWPDYKLDYSTGNIMDFSTVFAVLFSSVTGIMNGANMSGELKQPSKSIPKGTLLAILFTFVTYIILSFFISATTSRELLQNNYGFLQDTNLLNWCVIIGIFATTLSAALGNLIGASRILEALAKDEIFWFLLKPATIQRNGNPYIAVLISWILVQVVLVIGSLNAIAPLVSVFFLLAYTATNLATMALDLASAPNFRPSFEYFSWKTAGLGLIGSLVMCFLINAIFASVSVIVMMALVIVLHLRSMTQSWGSISQALIFHQVRKYLLLLDSRKDHVKFWRPQILLLVSNPRSCCYLIDFINDIKKGGLYVLGHVKVETFDESIEDNTQKEYNNWLSLIDYMKIKAFTEVTIADSIREGIQHLIRISGLGGMKPNTICLGFYDDCVPEDFLIQRRSVAKPRFYNSELNAPESFQDKFPNLRKHDSDKKISMTDYVHIIQDTLKMDKNVCLCRNFHQLDKTELLKKSNCKYIDVWPFNFFRPDLSYFMDNTCLFLLQLACILHMVPKWKKNTILRVFLCVNSTTDQRLSSNKEKKLHDLLQELRIPARIEVVSLESTAPLFRRTELCEDGDEDEEDMPDAHCPVVPENYLREVNRLVVEHSKSTAVTFCYLPQPPNSPGSENDYLKQLDNLTASFPPTVLVHGVHPVTSTTL